MSTIIVGFDFSAGSAKAVDLAIDIAGRCHANLRLVYVKGKQDDETALRAEIEQRNAAVLPLLRGSTMDYVIRSGKVSEQLIDEATQTKAFLIVVGTNGMSGAKTNWIGRNSYETVQNSTVPVLTVREHFNFNKALETIVIPIDASFATRQKVPFTVSFAKTFGSTIHLLGLYTSEADHMRHIVNNYMDSAVRMLDKNNVPYVVAYEPAPNLTKTTLEYANKVNADLISIMTDQEKNRGSWRVGTYAQQLLTESTRPILSFTPEEVGSVAR